MDRGSQLSYCWTKNLQLSKGMRIKSSMKQLIRLGDISVMFSLIHIQMVTYSTIYRYLYIHGLIGTQIFLSFVAEKA